MMLTFRWAQPRDAESLLACMQSVEQSGQMMVNPGERQLSKGRLEKQLQQTSPFWVALSKQEVVGYVLVKRNTLQRKQHCAYLVMGVHEGFRGKGIGKQLLQTLLQEKSQPLITRFELTVRADNHAARALYESFGFQKEGIVRHSLWIDGAYVDEWLMSKLI